MNEHVATSDRVISADFVRQAIDDMKPPALTLYGGDWLRDSVSGCSLAAQGLWLRLILIMHDAKPYGHLVGPNGEPLGDKTLIRLIGCTKGELTKLRAELIAAGVPRRSGDAEYDALFVANINGDPVDTSPLRVEVSGVVYSKRMIKDQRLRLLRRLSPIFGNPKEKHLTRQAMGQTSDARTYAGGLEKDSGSDSSPESKNENQSPRELTPQQAAVAAIQAALEQHTDRFALPTFGRMAAWQKRYTAEFVIAVVADLGAALDGKNASYLQKILETRHATDWKPAAFTVRTEGPSLVVEPEREWTLGDKVASHCPKVNEFIEKHGDPDENEIARRKFEDAFAREITATDDGGDRWATWKAVCEETGIAPKPKRIAS